MGGLAPLYAAYALSASLARAKVWRNATSVLQDLLRRIWATRAVMYDHCLTPNTSTRQGVRRHLLSARKGPSAQQRTRALLILSGGSVWMVAIAHSSNRRVHLPQLSSSKRGYHQAPPIYRVIQAEPLSVHAALKAQRAVGGRRMGRSACKAGRILRRRDATRG